MTYENFTYIIKVPFSWLKVSESLTLDILSSEKFPFPKPLEDMFYKLKLHSYFT